MLLGRATELQTLTALVDAIRGAQARALLVVGAAGIGKTSLMGAVQDLAEGGLLLQVRGVEAESTLAFGALSALLAPLQHRFDELPAPQAGALKGALAVGPPIPGDRLAVSVATLGVLSAEAKQQPVLVTVDDAQWLDPSSLECVLYAARRAPEGAGFVIAQRAEADQEIPERGLEVMRLGPLAADAAEELLARSAPELAGGPRQRVAETAQGNPLALEQLPRLLSEGQRRGRVPIPDPLAPGEAIQERFLGDSATLPASARRTILLAACSSSDLIAPILDAGGSVADFELCEESELLRLEAERFAFRHPLIRSGVYHGAKPSDRRDAHRALAGVEGLARGWHLAAAAVGPDEEAAQALELIGLDAAAKRAPAEAAQAMERSARLTADPGLAFLRLMGGGAFALAGGLPGAGELLEEIAERAPDPASKARVHGMLGLFRLFSAHVDEAIEMLTGAGEALVSVSPGEAAQMFSGASLACTTGAQFERALALSERAVSLIGEGTPEATKAQVVAVRYWALCCRGHGESAREALSEAQGLVDSVDLLSPDAMTVHFALNMKLMEEDAEGERERNADLVAGARDAGALMALACLLTVQAELRYRTGDWAQLGELFDEVHMLAEETGVAGAGVFGYMYQARLAAAQGHESDCRKCVDEALPWRRLGGGSIDIYVHAALGLAALGAGRVEEALRELQLTEVAAVQTGYEDPTFQPWLAEMIECHVRLGRSADARRALAKLDRQVKGIGTAFGFGLLERCRGLTCAAKDFDSPFQASLEHFERAGAPFERARTELVYGERLHRARRRKESRERLRGSLAVFEALGATPWAAQARTELKTAGGGQKIPTEGEELTEAERRVAEAAAAGLSTREVAAKLFLSPKTVEFHLSRIYRKLDIRSRAGIANALEKEHEASSK